jgi:nucleoside-diphosphate-sugar epimerase
MAHVLIAGCGYVGSELGRRLVAAGHQVVGLRRQPRGLPPGVVPLAADLTDASTLAGVPSDIEVVFYAASPAGFTAEAYDAVYVGGLANVLERTRGARRLFLVTSTSVYGQQDGAWVDEDSPTEPTSFAGRHLLEAEALAAVAPIRSTVVRLAGIYGPGRTSLIRGVADGTATIALDPVFTNRIHRDDCAGLLAHLMGLEDPASVYVGVDDEPAERGLVLRWLAEQLGVAAPPVVEATEPRRRGGNKRCRNDRARATGYAFAYPSFREGYAELIAARAYR